MPPLFHLQARRWPQSSVLSQSTLHPHRKFELDAEQILDNRTVRHRGEALTLRTTSNTRLKNVAPLRLRRTASTVSSPPISLLAGSSRHSPARKQPPRNAPQTCTPDAEGDHSPRATPATRTTPARRSHQSALPWRQTTRAHKATQGTSTQERIFYAQRRHRIPTQVCTQGSIHRRPNKRSPLHERGRLLSWPAWRTGRSARSFHGSRGASTDILPCPSTACIRSARTISSTTP